MLRQILAGGGGGRGGYEKGIKISLIESGEHDFLGGRGGGGDALGKTA